MAGYSFNLRGAFRPSLLLVTVFREIVRFYFALFRA